MKNLRQVNIRNLQPGMILGRPVVDERMTVILTTGTILEKPHISRLKFLGIRSVYIDDSKAGQAAKEISQTIINADNAFINRYNDVVLSTHKLFFDISQAKAGALREAKTEANAKLMPLAYSTGMMDMLYNLQTVSDSIYKHSVRVALLSGVIGKWLRLDKSTIQNLVLAGYLHDIGKTVLPEYVLKNDVRKMSPEVFELYIQHTTEGQRLLATADVDAGIKAAVLQHHEHVDGTGEPFGVAGNNIHQLAKIVAVANIYDSITAEKEGHRKQTPFEAVHIIASKMYSELDSSICVPFIVNVRNSFLGSEVRLTNGEKGKIIYYYPSDYASLPIVKTEMGNVIDLNRKEMQNISIQQYNPR